MAKHTTTAAEHVAGSGQSVMVVMGALMLTMLLAALDQTIVSTALPKIASEFDALNELSWVVTAYLLTSAVTMPLYGKVSDLLGRKKVLSGAIIIFLIGSALSGLAQNMLELVLFRGVQGLGAGGLMTLVLATIGDLVTPRERGRYQGLFGGVWGLASVAGPLLGGLFTDQFSWRWIFYINIPLGALALLAIAARLHIPVHRREHSIDYLGVALLSLAAVPLLLLAVWGGSTYAWTSTVILGLGALGVLGIIAFIAWERRAKEPLMPLELFGGSIFRVSSLLSFVSGVSMFATVIYLPVYQQVVRGYSATKSGLLMLPLVFGLLLASILSGRIISHTGRYRVFPLFGAFVTAIGLWLLSHVQTDTSEVVLSIWMFVVGVGIGSFMQVMTLAVQNSTDRKHLGSATSIVTFFRSIGSSFGASIFGGILTARFATHLSALLPAAAGAVGASNLSAGAAQIQALPPPVRTEVLQAFVLAFQDLFLWAIPFVVVAFIVALFLREMPLHHEEREMAEGEAFGI